MSFELEIRSKALQRILRIEGSKHAGIGGDRVIVLVKHEGVFKGSEALESRRIEQPGIGVGLDSASRFDQIIHVRGYQIVLLGDWPTHITLDVVSGVLANVAKPT